MRYALFHYNENGAPGGQADFDEFVVSEPRPRGLTKPIPYNRSITFADLANGNVLAVVDGEVRSVAEKERATAFRIVDRGLGRVALQTASGAYLSVAGTGRAGDVKVVENETRRRRDVSMGRPAAGRYAAAFPGDASLHRRSAGARACSPRTMPDRRQIERTAPVSSGASCADEKTMKLIGLLFLAPPPRMARTLPR